MKHSEIHELEKRISETIKKGFSRTTSPHEKSYDDADFRQMGFDVADMLLGEYLITPHPTDKEIEDNYAPISTYPRIESLISGFDNLIKDLNEYVYGKNGGFLGGGNDKVK